MSYTVYLGALLYPINSDHTRTICAGCDSVLGVEQGSLVKNGFEGVRVEIDCGSWWGRGGMWLMDLFLAFASWSAEGCSECELGLDALKGIHAHCLKEMSVPRDGDYPSDFESEEDYRDFLSIAANDLQRVIAFFDGKVDCFRASAC